MFEVVYNFFVDFYISQVIRKAFVLAFKGLNFLLKTF